MNTFSDPLKIIEQISFPDNAHIADFGCGSGAYSIAIAKKNKNIKVFAIDVQKDMIERLGSEAKSQGLDNIHVVWGDVDEKNESRLRDDSIDIVLIANTLFQVENKKTMLYEALRILKLDGRLIVIDWLESFGNIGPKEDHIVGESTAKLLIEECGMIAEQDIHVGEHHYGFIARKV